MMTQYQSMPIHSIHTEFPQHASLSSVNLRCQIKQA